MKVDRSFDKTDWLRFCERRIIPNVLEAVIRMDLDVLKDWCYERAYVQLSLPIAENQKIGYSTRDSMIIDVSKVDLAAGNMMEQGPVLVITFQVFMIDVVKNTDGKVIQGDLHKPVRMHHVWVLCRNMEELNPTVAWKVLEVHFQKGMLAI